MTTIGDSFAVVAILLGIGITAWAMTMSVALLFAAKTSAAREAVARSPWASFGIGVLLASTFGVVSVGLSASPFPFLKLLGLLGLFALLTTASLGMAGVTSLVGRRIASMDPNISTYGAFCKAGALLTVGAFFPIFGWFMVAPIYLLVGLGTGARCLLKSAASEGVSPVF